MPDPQHESSQDWTWVDSPNPDEMIFALFVDTNRITLANKPHVERPALGAITYLAATKFSELDPAFRAQHLNALGVGDWYFIGQAIGPKRATFYFFKNKTAVELLIPYYSRPRQGNHPWPMVVIEVFVESDYSFPISANTVDKAGNDTGVVTGPTNYIRDVVLNPVSEGTRIVTRKWLSATEPVIPIHRVPQPQRMHIQVNGASREYEEVIHDEIYLAPVRSGSKQYLTNGGASDVGGATQAHIFPATNVTRRKAYFLSDDAIQNQFGLWERTQIEVIPPKTTAVER